MPLTGAAAARLYDDHVDAVHALVARRLGPAVAPKATGEVFEQAIRSWDRFDPVRGTERLFLYGLACHVLRGYPDEETAHLSALSAGPSRPLSDPLVGARPTTGSTTSSGEDPDDADPSGDGDVPTTEDTPTPDAAPDGDAGLDDTADDASAGGVTSDPGETRTLGPTDDVNRVMRAVAALPGDDRDILLLSAWEGCQHGDVAEALDLTAATVRSSLNRIRRELKKAVGSGAGR